MNIEEIRAAREQAEAEICAILARFKLLTGMAIVACDVETSRVRFTGHERARTHMVDVRLTVESI